MFSDRIIRDQNEVAETLTDFFSNVAGAKEINHQNKAEPTNYFT